MKIDYHVHTHYSDDSEYQMEEVVQDAIKQGIEELCFTDHVDYGVKQDHGDLPNPEEETNGRFNVDYPAYYQQFLQLKEQYQEAIALKFGLEFGIQTGTISRYEKLFATYPFDFVLLSIHQVNNLEFWDGKFQEGKTDKQCYQEYYEEMLQVVKNYHDYSCLSHLDLIRRYLDKEANTFQEYEGILREILSYIIQDGKGIEINTSSLRYGIPDTTPSKDILRLYHELGGEIITLGSDSHVPKDLGEAIEESKGLLKEIGFRSFCTFDKMQPIFHPL